VTLPMLRFSALDPFFDIVRQGLAGLVDGDHYFDTFAPDAVFEFSVSISWLAKQSSWAVKPSWLCMRVTERVWRCMAQNALVVNISQTPGVVILEYEVQGNAVGSGELYEIRFISVVTIEDRKNCGLARLDGLAGGDVVIYLVDWGALAATGAGGSVRIHCGAHRTGRSTFSL